MIILQVSKIPDAAFTKCKVRLKNVFHVKKYLQVWIFVCIFVLFKHTHCKYYIWLFVLIVFHRPLFFELNISLD